MPTVTKKNDKNVTKDKAVEVRPKGAKDTAVVATKPVKNGTVTKGKAVINTSKEKSSTKATKAAPAKGKAKATPKGYKPVANSMRDFVFQAMKRGGSAKKIKSRAAQYAAKAGVEKYSETSAFKGFDVAYFAGMLKERGLDVEIADNKYKVSV